MKKLLLLMLVLITVFGCDTAYDSKVGNAGLKSLYDSKIENVRLNSLNDTTITIHFSADAIGPQIIKFDSSFVVESITTSYPGITPNDQRMAITQFYDHSHSPMFTPYPDTTYFTIDQFIAQFLFGNQSITYSDLNKRCDSLSVWFQAYPETFGTFSIVGHYSNVDNNEIIQIDLDDDTRSKTLQLTSSYKIKSIKAQQYGQTNKIFSIINNDSTINILDQFSVTNVKTYIPDEFSTNLTFSMVSPITSEYGFASFIIVIEK